MAPKLFKDRELIFNEHDIYDPVSKIHVMMDWEDEMMRQHANVICHNHGDILEIGFGMGISANYIQAFGVKSHTIMEIHPQVLEKLYIWSRDKDNVIIIEGDWAQNLDKLKLYDGIFHDTFLENGNRMELVKYLKPGGIFTFFNGVGYSKQYEMISLDVTPPEGNGYFNSNKYYVPIVKRV